jgi:hypothetical protein
MYKNKIKSSSRVFNDPLIKRKRQFYIINYILFLNYFNYFDIFLYICIENFIYFLFIFASFHLRLDTIKKHITW